MFFYSQGRPARVVAPPETQRPRDAPGRRAREGEFLYIRLSFYSSFFLFEYYTGDWTDGLFFFQFAGHHAVAAPMLAARFAPKVPIRRPTHHSGPVTAAEAVHGGRGCVQSGRRGR